MFNLVYVNNIASVKSVPSPSSHLSPLTEHTHRLWEALDFTKAGRIPRAGRLKKADGSGEEYVDAWVIYKKFDA